MSASTQRTLPSRLRGSFNARLQDPALWAWLLVALLALLPARAALHVIAS